MPLIFSRLQNPPKKVIIPLLLVLMLLYLYGVQQQFVLVNTDMTRTDQAAYMATAEQLKTSQYATLTDRARMPAFSFLLSLFYEPGMSRDLLFYRGKLLNTAVSLISLPILFGVFRRYLPLFTAVNLSLIHAFTIYIFKAPFVQAELLFYLFNFLGYLLMCRFLWQPESDRGTWKTAVFTGILLGMAHLTKASILPGLALFIGIAVLQAIFRQWKTSSPSRQFLRNLATPALVLLFFLLTIFPYIQNSKAQFGHYFYNVNSTFYIWYDHWDDVEAGTKAHGDRVGWPDMPPEEIPSAAKYFSEHSFTQIGQRLFDGLLVILITTLNSYGYWLYLFLLFGFVLVVALFNWQWTKTIVTQHLFLTLFIIGYFTLYILLYAWFWPISSGNRFTLALFSPMIFTLAFIMYRLFENQLLLKFNSQSTRMVHWGQLLNWTFSALLLVDLCITLSGRISTVYGGY
ncbi:MAG: hypothetical protein DHS20C20_10190 [Ardenticatenaceae bacterium]|nr:MAG: hypothetical protein DHS20C20_10190 [Ardenticatenaceae bacterium]